MKTIFRKFLPLLLPALLTLTVGACSDQKEEQPQGINVSLEIPTLMEVNTTDRLYTFTVLGGKAPLTTDKLMFTDADGLSYGCQFTEVDAKSATIGVSSGIKDGDYTVSVKRGSDKKQLGKTTVQYFTKIDYEPSADATVYGIVLCEGSPVADAVISDGVLVTKTNENGIYEMPSAKDYGYVFISVPGGYTVPCKGILPQNFVTLTKGVKECERADFQLLKVENQDRFKLLVFGDMHLANRNDDKAQFRYFINDVNAYVAANKGQNLYGITLGDMTWDLYWYDNKFCFEEYLDIAKDINLQINHTIGNHDHDMNAAGDFATVTRYRKALGPNFYSYNLGQCHIVALDNIECTNNGSGDRTYNVKLVNEEIEWLIEDLKYVPKDKVIILTCHAPILNANGTVRTTGGTSLLDDVLTGRNVHIFSGHTHVTYTVDQQSTRSTFENNSGAVCATWWWTGKYNNGVHVSQDGSPGGYMILDVDSKNLRWQYKTTGKDLSHQFRTYDGNKIDLSASTWCPKASGSYLTTYNNVAGGYTATNSNYVYINVWNYDPSWKIEVKENGTNLTATKVSAYDPLHVVSYTAQRANANGSITFATEKTSHIFRVQANSATSTLDIKVTDRFGNVYTETMTRPKAFTLDSYKNY